MQLPLHALRFDGSLPFVGRTEEIRRLTAFWDRSRRADGVYLGLLTGEAGIGKTRLLRELLPKIENAGGAVVHAKLYPYSSTEIPELIDGAITDMEIRRHLPMERTGISQQGVVGRLRRLSRLRRTLLVIEDVHLLDAEGMRAFESILRGVADDPIGVLCATRSIELTASGVLEDHLVETIPLKGLGPTDLATIWIQLFGTETDGEVIARLHEATGGNCLALRSALRSAIESGALTWSDRGTVVVGPMFAAVAHHKAGLIAEGLLLHLTPDERRAAATLALLGEVFSREAAGPLIAHAPEMLARLIDKQIITIIEQPAMPLSGILDWSKPYDKYRNTQPNVSAFPLLSFTHTLLHRQLLEEPSPCWSLLARTIARDMPLYSLVPLRFISELCEAPDVDLDDLRKVFYRMCAIAYDLSEGTTTLSAIRIADDAGKILQGRPDAWLEERDHMEAELLGTRISARKHGPDTDEYRDLFGRMDRLTRDPRSVTMASYRFMWHECRMLLEPFGRADKRAHKELAALLARFPELSRQNEYVLYFRVAVHELFRQDVAASRELEKQLNDFTALPGIAHEHGYNIYRLRILFLDLYESHEELAVRWRQVHELHGQFGDNEEALMLARCKLLAHSGWLEDMDEACEAFVRRLSRRESLRVILNIRSLQLVVHAAFQSTHDRIEADAARLLQEYRHEEYHTSRLLAIPMVAVGIIRGEADWIREKLEELLPKEGIAGLPLIQRLHYFILCLDAGNIRRELETYPRIIPPAILDLVLSIAAMLEGRGDIHRTLSHIRHYLAQEMVRISDLVYLHALFALVDRCRRQSLESEFVEHVAPILTSGLESRLQWLAERSLFALLRLLIGRYTIYLPAARLTFWRSRADNLEQEWQARRLKGDNSRVTISMTDTVTIGRPGEKAEQLRGARMRILLGLMTADRMLETPLSPKDFHDLIAGDDTTVEHPRKVMNLTVFRLRKILGADAVLTDSETPQLNLERVRVDLLDANELIRQTRRHLREEDLARAVPALLEALDIIGNRTPFPNLYDRFFEAMRDDFETGMRAAVVGTARMALREGDAAVAERLLHQGIGAFPGDEEVADLLAHTLVRLNRRAEAERISSRAA